MYPTLVVVHRLTLLAGVLAGAPVMLNAAPDPEPSAPLTSRVIPWESLAVKTTPNGQSRVVFNTSTATLENLECHITSLLPGKAAHAPHRHGHEEIIIIKEGTLEVNLNGQKQVVGPGSILFYAPNDLHGVTNVGTTMATYHVFTWKTPKTPPTVK